MVIWRLKAMQDYGGNDERWRVANLAEHRASRLCIRLRASIGAY